MAEIRLSRDECEQPRTLPSICMQCGELSYQSQKVEFYSRPPEGLPALLFYMVPLLPLFKHRRTIRAPLCRRHDQDASAFRTCVIVHCGFWGASIVFLFVLISTLDWQFELFLWFAVNCVYVPIVCVFWSQVSNPVIHFEGMIGEEYLFSGVHSNFVYELEDYRRHRSEILQADKKVLRTDVRLAPEECANAGLLPPICFHCGAPSAEVEIKEFRLCPDLFLKAWLLFLAPRPFGSLFADTRIVNLPVCIRHSGAEGMNPQRFIVSGWSFLFFGIFLMSTRHGENTICYVAPAILLGFLLLFYNAAKRVRTDRLRLSSDHVIVSAHPKFLASLEELRKHRNLSETGIYPFE